MPGLSKDEVDHPAPANVFPFRLTTVVEDIVVVAFGVLQRVGQDRQPLEGAVIVDAPCDSDGDLGAPGGFEGDRAKRVAEDLAD